MKEGIIGFLVGSLIVMSVALYASTPRQYDRTKFLAIVERVIYLSQHPEEQDDIDDLEFQFQMAEWVKRVDAKVFGE